VTNKVYNRVIETSSNTPSGATPQSISLSGTSPTLTFVGAGTSAGRKFVDKYANGDTCRAHIYQTNSPNLWVIADVTFATGSPNTLSLATANIIDGSSGAAALPTWTGTVTCVVELGALDMQSGIFAAQAVVPGGRLTLTSGTPVTTSDVTGATSVYYTPYLHDIINLWTGSAWTPVQFTEQTLALGTVTSGLPYDVFGYLSSGALALEKLAWTNGTTRATAITLQDGRYCKSGDKTRLYLGTFYSSGTTTTEDSLLKRYLFNAYNRRFRALKFFLSSSHSYNGGYRYWNNSAASRVEFLLGLAEDAISSAVYGECSITSSTFGIVAQNMDVNNAFDSFFYLNPAGSGTNGFAASAISSYSAGVGFHYIAALESSASSGSNTFTSVGLSGGVNA
jgi:hypothetical protein